MAPASSTTRSRSGARVEASGLAKSYQRVPALRDASLRLEPGELVVVSGASGSGKSTLLNLIGGLAEPDSGSVLVDGRPPDGARFRRDVVGFVFQLHHLLPRLSAAGNVELPLIAARVPRAERRERAHELLGEVGLGARADARPAELSGGERQRVAVARALANHPRLLLADEPTGALDSATSARVLALIERLRERHGMTVLVVTYDPAVGDHADRTLEMSDGVLAA